MFAVRSIPSLLVLLVLAAGCGDSGADVPYDREDATELASADHPSQPEPEEPTPEPPPRSVDPDLPPVKGADGELHAGTVADPVPIDIDFLGEWEFIEKEQPFPEHVLAVHGRVVTIVGFMLPDIEFEDIRDFHLVRSLWGCCFGAPPRVNEIVRVTVRDKEGIDYTYEAIEVTGYLDVVYETEDGIIEDLYRLDAISVVDVEYADPQAPADFDPATDLQGFVPTGG